MFLGVAPFLMIKRKINFSFYRRKGAPNRTRFREARLVAYASLQKFSKYTYYLELEPKFLRKQYLVTKNLSPYHINVEILYKKWYYYSVVFIILTMYKI